MRMNDLMSVSIHMLWSGHQICNKSINIWYWMFSKLIDVCMVDTLVAHQWNIGQSLGVMSLQCLNHYQNIDISCIHTLNTLVRQRIDIGSTLLITVCIDTHYRHISHTLYIGIDLISLKINQSQMNQIMTIMVIIQLKMKDIEMLNQIHG